MKRIIHVHQQKVRRGLPAVIIRTYKGTHHVAEAITSGPVRVIHNYKNPLSCGAKVWIETDEEVTGIFGNGKEITV